MTYTKEVRGQNFFALDINLQRSLEQIAPGALNQWGDLLSEFGAWVGGEVDRQAEYTDRYAPPRLHVYDREGEVVNRIIKNPAWEKVEDEVYRRGIVGLNYTEKPAPFAVTFAMNCLLAQADLSMSCPVTMTHSVAYVIDKFAPAAVRARYLPQLVTMDGGVKSGGTWATELHGGSDVGATTTVARLEGDHFRLSGLKWFTSNPDGGIAIVTARADESVKGYKGLGLYVVPTHLEDGSVNNYRIRRLKDKLGTRGVPTAEIELDGAWAEQIVAPPDGLRIMMEALENSRIHLAVGAAGIQWRAFMEARAFAHNREAFGRTITDFPMVQDELLKMLAGIEASYALAFEACCTFDAASRDEANRPWLRLATALAKYLICEISISNCRAAMELIGGNAYTDDYVLPRLLRDAQVNAIWEGPANIQALEVLRMLGTRFPGYEAYCERVEHVLGEAPADLARLSEPLERSYKACQEAVEYIRGDPAVAERNARKLMHFMAETLAGTLLLEQAAADWAAGDARKTLITGLFLENTLDPPARGGVLPGNDLANRHFNALVGFDTVPTESL